MVPPVILDRRPATEHGPVIIDDAERARRELRIKPVQHLNRRLIQIAIEPKNGDFLYCRGRNRVFEPAFDPAHLVGPEAHAPEVLDQLFDAHRQLQKAMEVVASVSRVVVLVR